MTRRRARDLLIGVLLFCVASLGALWQVNETTAQDPDSLPRLVCPLH
jgi:hypothetical protein